MIVQCALLKCYTIHSSVTISPSSRPTSLFRQGQVEVRGILVLESQVLVNNSECITTKPNSRFENQARTPKPRLFFFRWNIHHSIQMYNACINFSVTALMLTRNQHFGFSKTATAALIMCHRR